MNSAIKTQSKLGRDICSHCTGKRLQKTCYICGGKGELKTIDNNVLYWGKRLDIWHVTFDQITEKGKHLLVSLLILLSFLGKIMLFFYILHAYSFTVLPIRELWFSDVDYRISFGWISFALDMYIFYFLTSAIESRHRVTKLASETSNEKKYIDVSKYTTISAMKAIENAWRLADKYNQHALFPFHVFTSLLDTSPIKTVFARIGISYDVLTNKLAKQFADNKIAEHNEITISDALRDILIESFKISYENKKEYVDETSILSAISQKDTLVKDILYDLTIDTDKLDNVLHWVDVRTLITKQYRRYRKGAHFKPKGNMDRAMTAQSTPFLDRFSTDLTRLAKQGYLDLTVGREEEYEQIFRLLETGATSLVLLGPSGVGKTAMLYGLAQFMVEERVPRLLQDKRLVNLDSARLVSGVIASVAAERLLRITDEVMRAGNIVLTIENVDSLIGISTGAENSMDLLDIIGSIVGKKHFLIIATAKPPDYSAGTNIALSQIFKVIRIDEPSQNLAIRIVEAKTMVLEYKHNVFFSYDAIAELIKLCFRYLPEEYMPAKAIAILEEIALMKSKEQDKNNNIIRVTDVAKVISEKIKIPVSQVSQKESELLLKMEDLIHEHLIDQEQAVSAVAKALRRSRAELTSGERPIANFLFLGPTGVGKTQLAKTVASIYFGSEDSMIRLDMSEYQDVSSVDKLIGKIGTPGNLTREIKAKPFSILLLDELEKSHTDILNIFLQVMDDGRLTEGTGRVIDFTNVIIIATSNAGSQFIQDSIHNKVSAEKIASDLLEGELRNYFKPEFLNRFDGIIVFKPLSQDDVLSIARLMVTEVQKNLEIKKGVSFTFDEDALKALALLGYQPEFGARPMRRIVQDKIDTPLSSLILQQKVQRRDTVHLTVNGLKVIKRQEL